MLVVVAKEPSVCGSSCALAPTAAAAAACTVQLHALTLQTTVLSEPTKSESARVRKKLHQTQGRSGNDAHRERDRKNKTTTTTKTT